MRIRRAQLLAATAGLALWGCTGSSPTAPGTLQVLITASISDAAQVTTLLEAQLQLDGIIVADATSDVPFAVATLNAAGISMTGAHTMAYVVVGQTSSPNRYTIAATDIRVYDTAGNFVKDVTLAPQTVSLATGQAITYNFNL